MPSPATPKSELSTKRDGSGTAIEGATKPRTLPLSVTTIRSAGRRRSSSSTSTRGSMVHLVDSGSKCALRSKAVMSSRTSAVCQGRSSAARSGSR